MRLIDASSKLKALGQPVIQTADAAASLGVSRAHASKILARLSEAKVVQPLVRGRWLVADKPDQFEIAQYLVAPSLSYVSLQSALFYHGLVSQIPEVTYSVTTGKTRRYETPLGTFSFHHLEPEFFFGFEQTGLLRMATPEKALFDFFYMTPAKSRFFSALPEVEIPKSFDPALALKWAKKIPPSPRRILVEEKFRGLGSVLPK